MQQVWVFTFKTRFSLPCLHKIPGLSRTHKTYFSELCHSPAMLKNKDKQQLLALYIQCDSTITVEYSSQVAKKLFAGILRTLIHAWCSIDTRQWRKQFGSFSVPAAYHIGLAAEYRSRQQSTVMRSTLRPTIRCLWHWPAK